MCSLKMHIFLNNIASLKKVNHKMNNKSVARNTTDGHRTVLKAGNVSCVYNTKTCMNVQSHQQHLTHMIARSDHQHMNLPLNHGNTVGIPEVINHPPQFERSFFQGPQMIGQDGYKDNVDMRAPQTPKVHLSTSAQSIQTMAHNPQQLQTLQKMHYAHQMQPPQTPNWNFANQHMSTLPSDSIINQQIQQS